MCTYEVLDEFVTQKYFYLVILIVASSNVSFIPRACLASDMTELQPSN